MTRRRPEDNLISELEITYREQAKNHLSSHSLADFRKCPLLYFKKSKGLIPDIDRPSYMIGRTAHKLILEGRKAFNDSYAVGGPINDKTGKPFGSTTKTYQEWATAQNKPTITDDQLVLVESMTAGVQANKTAMRLLKQGQAEGVLRLQYQGLPCQGRLDWFNPEYGIIDLKTCEDLTWFESDARRYGYLHQLAFYRSLLAEASGESVDAYVIAVEKSEPFRCGVWRVTPDVLNYAKKENEQAIETLKRCSSTGNWPTGYEDIRPFDYL